MQLLIAHGDAASRLALKLVAADLPCGDLEVIECGEGVETLDVLLAADAALVALIDWDLPGCDGPELCRLVRAYRHAGPPYIILLARERPSACRGPRGRRRRLRSHARQRRRAAGAHQRGPALRGAPVGAPQRGRRRALQRARRSTSCTPFPSSTRMLSPEDDEIAVDDVVPEARFELQSVLVAR